MRRPGLNGSYLGRSVNEEPKSPGSGLVGFGLGLANPYGWNPRYV